MNITDVVEGVTRPARDWRHISWRVSMGDPAAYAIRSLGDEDRLRDVPRPKRVTNVARA